MSRGGLMTVVVLLLTGCGADAGAGPWVGEGIVVDLRYDDPDDWTTEGACIDYNEDGRCVNRWPDQHHHDDAHWHVLVSERDGTDHLIEVDEPTHERCRLGARWIETRCQG